MNPEDFWKPFEYPIGSYDEFAGVTKQLHSQLPGKRFVWRGVGNAQWALHSSLYRHLVAKTAGGPLPREEALAAAEQAVLQEFERWGLHNNERGRLSAPDQLAMIQHHGGKTRLLDVTFNAFIALWFAVESTDIDADGRVFAFDISQRLIERGSADYAWLSAHDVPWTDDKDWSSWVRAWRPAPFDRRIAAQQAGFLLGGVPNSSGPDGPMQWPKSTNKSVDGSWKHEEVLASTCFALRVHKFPLSGPVPSYPAFTFRVEKKAKESIRTDLRAIHGYSHSAFFPDYGGFAAYGVRGWDT